MGVLIGCEGEFALRGGFLFRNCELKAGDSQVLVTESAVSVTEVEANETEVKSGLEEAGDGGLNEHCFEVARDICEGLGGVSAV